jgi:hypothetical protein
VHEKYPITALQPEMLPDGLWDRRLPLVVIADSTDLQNIGGAVLVMIVSQQHSSAHDERIHFGA